MAKQLALSKGKHSSLFCLGTSARYKVLSGVALLSDEIKMHAHLSLAVRGRRCVVLLGFAKFDTYIGSYCS